MLADAARDGTGRRRKKGLLTIWWCVVGVGRPPQERTVGGSTLNTRRARATVHPPVRHCRLYL